MTNQQVSDLKRSDDIRTATERVGGAAAILGGATLMFPTPDPDQPGFLAFNTCNIIAFVLLIVAVLALRRLGVPGPSWLGRFGVAATVVALAGFALVEFATRSAPKIGESFHPITVPLLAVAMTMVGVATLRAGVWQGWRRATPLICGILPLAVGVPTFVIFGPNATVIALTWATWVVLGGALLATASGHRR